MNFDLTLRQDWFYDVTMMKWLLIESHGLNERIVAGPYSRTEAIEAAKLLGVQFGSEQGNNNEEVVFP